MIFLISERRTTNVCVTFRVGLSVPLSVCVNFISSYSEVVKCSFTVHVFRGSMNNAEERETMNYEMGCKFPEMIQLK